MDAFFLNLLNMSITASWLVLAVVLLRLLLKKAPRAIFCVLWALVGLRLVVPFSWESVLSLIPSAETVPPEIFYAQTPAIESGISVLNQAVNPILAESLAPQAGNSVNPVQIIAFVFSVVWVIGMAAMIVYAAVSFLRLHGKLREAAPAEGHVWQCDRIAAPFILGVFRPRIYLPSDLAAEQAEYVIAHENAHLKRRDHWWKPLGFLLLTVYWFNPVIWAAYILLCRDIELACDERVMKEMGTEHKKAYSEALLQCSVPRRMIAACPLAFGEVGVKARIRSVLSYKKPALWIMIAAVIVCVVFAVCFLTNPPTEADDGVILAESGSEHSGVIAEFASINVSDAPTLTIRWKNTTNRKVMFGEMHHIYHETDGKWVNCSIMQEDVRHTIAYELPAGGEYVKEYELGYKNMTESGTYRFESVFSFDEEPDKSYKAWVEFELQSGIALTTAAEYRTEALVYDCGVFSFTQTPEIAPQLRIVHLKNAELLQIAYPGTQWGDVGTLSEITLGEQNFDDRFAEAEIWFEGLSPASLREGNEKAWELKTENSDELYLFLEQKNGEHYWAYGYYGRETPAADTPDGAMIRWVYRLGNAPETVRTDGNDTAESLDAAISEAILEQYRTEKPDGLIRCESHILLHTHRYDITPDKLTAYVLFMYREYSPQGGKPEPVSGSCLPAALTFTLGENGEYELSEYWEPRDGSYYTEDIKEKFPSEITEQAMNIQEHAEQLQKECDAKAQEYLNGTGNIDANIERLLETIVSSPSHSSVPGDYIAAHREEYDTIIGYDEAALRYCFKKFLEGGQTGLEGHIMESLCRDIMPAFGEAFLIDSEPDTGQDWFDSYRSNAKILETQYGAEELKKIYPVSWLLLQMMAETNSMSETAWYMEYFLNDPSVVVLLGADGAFTDAEMGGYCVYKLGEAYDYEKGNTVEEYNEITQKYFGKTITNFENNLITVIPETKRIRATGWSFHSTPFLILKELSEEGGVYTGEFYFPSVAIEEWPEEIIQLRNDLLKGEMPEVENLSAQILEIRFERKQDENGRPYLLYRSIKTLEDGVTEIVPYRG